MSIYTRTGDDGTTALFGGKRLRKDTAVIEAYGTVDELNSYVGLMIAMSHETASYRPLLNTIQKDLMTMGSVLSGWTTYDRSVFSGRITEMEQWMDTAEKEIGGIHTFILPGGTPLGAVAHIARTVCRRAERRIVSLKPADTAIVTYVNRLSDLFFMVARVINKADGVSETAWVGIVKKAKR